MILLIMLILILSISFGIKILAKVKQEEAIFISLFGMGLFIYILGIINLLWISPYIIVILSITSIIYTVIKIVKKEEKIQNLLTLPTLFYIIFTCMIYYFVRNIQYEVYDEFMFWGTNLKQMLKYSCLWADAKIDGIHLIYPPFTAIVEYIFCIFANGFSESVSYFAIIMLIFTSIMPLLKNEKYSIKSLFKIIITFIITYIAIVFFRYRIASLSVDCILGVTFAVAMYLAYSLKEKKDYIVLIALLSSITLIKTNGILLAGIVIMQLFFREAFELIKKKEKYIKNILKKLSMVFILLIIIISIYSTWKIYYTLNGKQIDERHDKNNVGNIDVVEFLNAILLTDNASNRDKKIVTDFWDSLLKEKIIQKNYLNSTIWIFAIVNVFNLVYIIIQKDKAKNFVNFLSINIGFVLYLLSTLLMFMFVFQSDQGNLLMGFDRYVQTYALAMVLNMIYIVLENINLKSVITILIVLSAMSYGLERKMIDPREGRDRIYQNTISNAKDILDNVKEDEKVYLVDQRKDAGTEFVRTRYLITPIKTNLLYEWNIGYSTNNIYYRIVITKEKFFEKLIEENYDYVYIIGIEESFIKNYGGILSEDAKQKLEVKYNTESSTGVLLKVNKEEKILDLIK